MARPVKSIGNVVKVQDKKPDIDIVCTKCGQSKNAKKDYYIAYNSKIAVAPFCKDCVIENCLTEDKSSIDVEKLQTVLRQLDRPYIHQLYITSIKKYGDKPESAVGKIMKDLALPQYRALSYANSDFGHLEDAKTSQEEVIEEEKPKAKKVPKVKKADREELVDKWGEFDDSKLIRFEKEYQQMAKGYPIQTPLHQKALITYCKYTVLKDMAIERGDIQEAKMYGELEQKARTDAKLNPNQLKKDDMQVGGVDSFSQMSMLVAKRDGLINVPMKYLAKPLDVLDVLMWENVNYNRAIFNMPETTYEEMHRVHLDRIKDFNQRYNADLMNNDLGTWGD